MLSSRPISSPGRDDSRSRAVRVGGGPLSEASTSPGSPGGGARNQPYGRSRVGTAYGVTLLAAVLGLPVLAAGLILANNCQLYGSECTGRFAFGLIGGAVLAAGVQLLLALHVGLGWRFWGCSALLMATAAAQSAPVALALVLFVAPGIAAWVTDPPNRRSAPLEHWAPRLSVFAVVAVAGPLLGLLIGR